MERRPGINYNDPNNAKRKSNGKPQGPVRFPEIANNVVEEELYGWPEGRE